MSPSLRQVDSLDKNKELLESSPHGADGGANAAAEVPGEWGMMRAARSAYIQRPHVLHPGPSALRRTQLTLERTSLGRALKRCTLSVTRAGRAM